MLSQVAVKSDRKLNDNFLGLLKSQVDSVPDPGGGAQGAAAPPPKVPPNLIFTLIFLTNSVDLLQGQNDFT